MLAVLLVVAVAAVGARGESTAGDPDAPQVLFDPYREPRTTPSAAPQLYLETPTIDIAQADLGCVTVGFERTCQSCDGDCPCSHPRSCVALNEVLDAGDTLSNRIANSLLDCNQYIEPDTRVCVLTDATFYFDAISFVAGADSVFLLNFPPTYQIGDLERDAAVSYFDTGMKTQTRDNGDCEESIRRMACWQAFRTCSGGDTPDRVLPVCASVCANLRKACATDDECEDDRVYRVTTGPSSTCTGGALPTSVSSALLLAAVLTATAALIANPTGA